MTYLELCELVYEKVNRHPVTFSSVDLGKSAGEWIVPDPEMREVIRATADAYTYILNLSTHWKFLRINGALFTLSSGVDTYDRSGYQSIDWNSLYSIKTGETGRTPIYRWDYQYWKFLQQSTETPSGRPLYIVDESIESVRFWPKPDATYTVYGEAVEQYPTLSSSSDAPVWDSARHTLVADVGAMLVEQRVDSQDEVAQSLNVKSRNQAVAHNLQRLIADYVPNVWGTCVTNYLF